MKTVQFSFLARVYCSRLGDVKRIHGRQALKMLAFARNAWRGLPPAQELSQL